MSDLDRNTAKQAEKNRGAFVWQLAAGGFFLLVQLAALLYKSEGPLGPWVWNMVSQDPWKGLKFFSLGLVGVAFVIYALLDYYFGRGVQFFRGLCVCLGLVLLVRQYDVSVAAAQSGTLPWQGEGAFGGLDRVLTDTAACLAQFSTGLLGLVCLCIPFFRLGKSVERGYWRDSLSALHSTRLLVFAALMVAMARALSIVPGIPIAHTKLTFGFLARALCALVCGPILGLVYGFVEDILGFILQPTGEFFFGYTLSTMLGVLAYAVFLYRRRITVTNIVLANVVVNIFVNALLGSVWTMMTRGGGYWGWFVPSILKNLATIIPKSVLLYFLFRGMLPILQRMGVRSKELGDRISWI